MMFKKISVGFILPGTMILSIIIITAIGFLYQQSIVQKALARNLVQQTALYEECYSLIPILKRQLDQLGVDEINTPDLSFFTANDEKAIRWEVDRSAWKHQKIQFTFHLIKAQTVRDPIKLTISYQRP
jgi:hypothetical protein